jgi:hypothetical protein
MFLRKKLPQRGFDHPPATSAEVKERVALYLYSPSGFSWPVLGWTLPYVLQKPCYPPTRLHGVITQNATIWIFIALNFKSHTGVCIWFKINKWALRNTPFHEINHNLIHAVFLVELTLIKKAQTQLVAKITTTTIFVTLRLVTTFMQHQSTNAKKKTLIF